MLSFHEIAMSFDKKVALDPEKFLKISNTSIEIFNKNEIDARVSSSRLDIENNKFTIYINIGKTVTAKDKTVLAFLKNFAVELIEKLLTEFGRGDGDNYFDIAYIAKI